MFTTNKWSDTPTKTPKRKGAKTKVAFFAENLIDDFDGASRTMFQIIDRIDKEEFDFLFFCGIPPTSDIGFEVIVTPTMGIPFVTAYDMSFPSFSKKRLKKRLDEFKPDIIHFASPSLLGSFAKSYGKKNDIPVISIYHTHFISYMPYVFRKVGPLVPFISKKVINVTKNLYQDLAAVYVPTQEIIKELKQLCQIEGKNLKLWQRGLNRIMFNPGKKDEALIRSIVKNDKPNILFASRLVWEKNLQTLINLYNYCGKEGHEVNFIIAGDGAARAELERQMPNAFFVDMVNHDHLSKLYASCDIFFFPSNTETFGNVVTEAMASGIPCVLADGGGPKSIVQHGHTGFLCEVNNVEQYWKHIEMLLNDSILRQDLIDNALDYTASLSWERLVKVYFSDLKVLANSK